MFRLIIATVLTLLLLVAFPIETQAGSNDVNVSVSVLEKRSDQTINDFDLSRLAMADNGQEEQKPAPKLSLWHRIIQAIVGLFR